MTTLEQQQKEARERYDSLPTNWRGYAPDEVVYSFLDSEIAKAYNAGQESERNRVAMLIDTKYPPYAFHNSENGDAYMGVREQTHIRMATPQEIELITELKKSLSTEKLEVTKNHEEK